MGWHLEFMGKQICVGRILFTFITPVVVMDLDCDSWRNSIVAVCDVTGVIDEKSVDTSISKKKVNLSEA